MMGPVVFPGCISISKVNKGAKCSVSSHSKGSWVPGKLPAQLAAILNQLLVSQF